MGWRSARPWFREFDSIPQLVGQGADQTTLTDPRVRPGGATGRRGEEKTAAAAVTTKEWARTQTDSTDQSRVKT